MYIAKQMDGQIIAGAYELKGLIRDITRKKILAFNREYKAIDLNGTHTGYQDIDIEYYRYIDGLKKLYNQANLLNGRDYFIDIIERVYNNGKFIDGDKFITITAN